MNSTIDEIVGLLTEAKAAYYDGKPIMSDIEFDVIEENLRSLDPNNKYFGTVGSPVTDDDDSEPHDYPMLSMQKLPLTSSIESWYRSISIPLDTEMVIEPKVDGISGSLIYKGGILIYGKTRGDGYVGKRIYPVGRDENNSIPLEINIKTDIEIRGEFVIPKIFGTTVFKDMPLRNVCAGAIKSGTNFQYVQFTAYQILGNFSIRTESESIELLDKLGFTTVYCDKVDSPDEIRDYVDKYIKLYRDEYALETDGIVITINDKETQSLANEKKIVRNSNHYNIAIKPPAKTGETKLLGIEWNVSRTGSLIPVAVFQPVIIGNVEITRATMVNLAFLKGFGKRFYVGDTVYVSRANDVIPKINDIIHDGNKMDEIKFPTHCPCCGNELTVTGKHLMCENIKCSGREVGIIYNWVEKMDMKNIGFKFIDSAYKAGIIRNIQDLYDVDLPNKLSIMDGFVQDGKRISKIMKAINKSRQNVYDIDIIHGVGIPGIGRTVLENLGLTNISTLPLDIADSRIHGLAVCRYILEWLVQDGHYDLLMKLKTILHSKSNKSNVNSNGKTVVITGTFDIKRNEIESLLKEKGYSIQSAVKGSTDFLIAGEGCTTSSKYKKAKELDVKIVGLSDLL